MRVRRKWESVNDSARIRVRNNGNGEKVIFTSVRESGEIRLCQNRAAEAIKNLAVGCH